MRVRWSPGTCAWIRKEFGEEIALSSIPLVQNTLKNSDLVDDVTLQISKREHHVLKRLRQKFPKFAPRVLGKLEWTSLYRKLIDTAIELHPSVKKKSLSIGGELDQGRPLVSLSLAKSFLPSGTLPFLTSPILLSVAARAKLLTRELPYLQLQATQPVIRDRALIDTRAFSVHTQTTHSFWWTDVKQKLNSKIIAASGAGSLSLVNGKRIQLAPRIPRLRSPLGDLSIHPRFGISLSNFECFDAVFSLEARYRKYVSLSSNCYLENRIVCGALGQATEDSEIPLDEFLPMGNGQDPVRGKPFQRTPPVKTRTEGVRHGIAGSFVLGRRSLFHPCLGAFGYVDSAHTSNDNLRLTTGVGMGLQLSGDVGLEGSVGVSPLTWSPVWDMRVNANF